MPTQEEPKQDQSVKDQPAAAEFEKKTDEIQTEDADAISGGFGQQKGGD